MSGFVTVTFTGPTSALAPVVATIAAPVSTCTDVAVAVPIVTVADEAPFTWNPVPVIVTTVPPATGPEVGLIVVTVGAGVPYVYPFTAVAVWLSGFVITTFAGPAAPAGLTNVSVPAVSTVTDVAALPPTVTAAPVWNPVPVIVTRVPPPVGPNDGFRLVIVGAGWPPVKYVNPFTAVADVASGFVTVTFAGPAAPAGVTHVIWLPDTTVTVVAAVPPTATVAPAW